MKLNIQKTSAFLVFAATILLSFTSLWNQADNHIYDFLLQSRAAHKPLEQTDQVKQLILTEKDRKELDFPNKTSTTPYFMNIVPFLNEAGFKGCLYTPELYLDIPERNRAPIFSAFSKRSFPMLITPASNDLASFQSMEQTNSEQVFLESNLIHPQFLDKGDIPHVDYFVFPKTSFLNKFTQTACLGAITDPDGICRRIPLLYEYKDGYLPSAALYYMMLQTGTDSHGITVKPGSWIKLTGTDGSVTKIPVDSQCAMYLPYTGPLTLEKSTVLLEEVSSNSPQLVDKILFISEALFDSDNYVSTPFEKLYTKTGAQVTALNAFFTGNYIQDYPLWLKLAIILVLLTAIEIASYQRRDLGFNLIYALVLASFVIFEYVLWSRALYKPWFLGAFACIIITWGFSLCTRHLYFKKQVLDSDFSEDGAGPKAQKVEIQEEREIILSQKD